MRVNMIKFFRIVNNCPKPDPKPSVKQRFEFVRQDKKLDKFL